MSREPPQQWFECDACDGEGRVWTGRWSHSVNSATIDPPHEIMEPCGKCNGAGGWLDDAEPDAAIEGSTRGDSDA